MKEAVCNQCKELKLVFASGFCNRCTQLIKVQQRPGIWMNGVFVLQKWIDALPGLNVLARLTGDSGIFVFTLPCRICGATREFTGSLRKINKDRPCLSCKTKLQIEKYGVANRLRGEGVPYNLLSVWHDMTRRCRKSGNAYLEKYYYNRGIRVTQAWKDYKVFESWALASGYKEGLSIERKDNNGNYEPSNCVWVTMAQQSHNRRDNKLTEQKVKAMRELYARGNTLVSDLVAQFGISAQHVARVLQNKHWKL